MTTTTDDARVTPHDLEAEKAVLGAILIRSDRFYEVCDLLAADQFFRGVHRLVYQGMIDLAVDGHAIDILLLRALLDSRGQLETVGGAAYLAALTDFVPINSHIVQYATVVRDKAMLRALETAGKRLAHDALADTHDPPALIAQAERELSLIADSVGGASTIVDMPTLVEIGEAALRARIEQPRGVTGVAMGWSELDAMTHGLQPGHLILVAARPSMGKSALALNAAYFAAATAAVPTLYFSIEMAKEELFFRLLSAEARIDGHGLTAGYVSDVKMRELPDTYVRLASAPLFIDDSSAVSLMALRARCRRVQSKYGLGLVVVDYLQLMQLPKAENRNIAVGEVSRGLKLLARELNVPIVALSQLSRDSEKRGGDKRPQLSDLRDSGALEQDADVVMLLHRPEVYDATAVKGAAELTIAKQRGGATGRVDLEWDAAHTRFGSGPLGRQHDRGEWS